LYKNFVKHDIKISLSTMKNFRNSFYSSAEKFPKDKILSAPLIKTMNCHGSQPAMILCHCDHVRNQFSNFFRVAFSQESIRNFTYRNCVSWHWSTNLNATEKNQTIVTMNFYHLSVTHVNYCINFSVCMFVLLNDCGCSKKLNEKT
jgi:hypothetical protein